MYFARNARSVPMVFAREGGGASGRHVLEDVLEHLVLGVRQTHAVRDLVDEARRRVHVRHELVHVVERRLVGLDHDVEAGCTGSRSKSVMTTATSTSFVDLEVEARHLAVDPDEAVVRSCHDVDPIPRRGRARRPGAEPQMADAPAWRPVTRPQGRAAPPGGRVHPTRAPALFRWRAHPRGAAPHSPSPALPQLLASLRLSPRAGEMPGSSPARLTTSARSCVVACRGAARPWRAGGTTGRPARRTGRVRPLDVWRCRRGRPAAERAKYPDRRRGTAASEFARSTSLALPGVAALSPSGRNARGRPRGAPCAFARSTSGAAARARAGGAGETKTPGWPSRRTVRSRPFVGGAESEPADHARASTRRVQGRAGNGESASGRNTWVASRTHPGISPARGRTGTRASRGDRDARASPGRDMPAPGAQDMPARGGSGGRSSPARAGSADERPQDPPDTAPAPAGPRRGTSALRTSRRPRSPRLDALGLRASSTRREHLRGEHHDDERDRDGQPGEHVRGRGGDGVGEDVATGGAIAPPMKRTAESTRSTPRSGGGPSPPSHTR